MKALCPLKSNASSGVRLRAAMIMVKWVVRRPCQFKIGMTTDPGTRWLMYQDRDSKWIPSHLFVLLPVQGFEAAGWAETALIQACRELEVEAGSNMNLWHRDKGGTGSKTFPDAVRWLYLAAVATARE